MSAASTLPAPPNDLVTVERVTPAAFAPPSLTLADMREALRVADAAADKADADYLRALARDDAPNWRAQEREEHRYWQVRENTAAHARYLRERIDALWPTPCPICKGPTTSEQRDDHGGCCSDDCDCIARDRAEEE